MDPAPLHPNLARVAALYDQVTAEWASGRITLDEARSRLSDLVARDDQGAQWRIDPGTGNWCRLSLDGHWQAADPPTFGLATPDGWDLSGGIDPFADPRRHIGTRDVDVTRVTDTSSLTGATLRAAAPQSPERPLPRDPQPGGDGRRWRWALAGVLVAVVAAAGLRACGGGEGGTHAEQTTTTAPDAATTAPVGRGDAPGG